MALAAYVAVVEDRPPILRAALMATTLLCGWLFYRKIELLNTLAVAALVLLAARPSALADSSFLLSFLTIRTIVPLAVPWPDRPSAPYRLALEPLAAGP